MKLFVSSRPSNLTPILNKQARVRRRASQYLCQPGNSSGHRQQSCLQRVCPWIAFFSSPLGCGGKLVRAGNLYMSSTYFRDRWEVYGYYLTISPGRNDPSALRLDNHPAPGHNGAMESAPLATRPPTRLRYSHAAMIDMLVAEPQISQNELAARFGYSAAWVSTVMSTDMFKAALAARREEVVDPALKATLDERFRAVVTKSLQVLQEKLSAPAAAIPDNLALRAAEMGAKALGLGGNALPPAPSRSEGRLTELAERLLFLQSKVREVSYVQDVEAREIVAGR